MASVTSPNGITEAQAEMLQELFGKASAKDERTLLFDKVERIDGAGMKKVANAGKEPVTVELNGPRERKTMNDGTVYEVDDNGCWRKVSSDA